MISHGMSKRAKSWGAFVDMQNRARERDGLPKFDAKLREYPAMMAGYYEGYRAAEFQAWSEGALAGWQASGEGWNDEMACGDPDKMPDFEALNPHKGDAGMENATSKSAAVENLLSAASTLSLAGGLGATESVEIVGKIIRCFGLAHEDFWQAVTLLASGDEPK